MRSSTMEYLIPWLFLLFFWNRYTCVIDLPTRRTRKIFETFNRAKSSCFICESLSILPGSWSSRYTKSSHREMITKRFAFYENSLVSVFVCLCSATDVDFQYMYFCTYIRPPQSPAFFNYRAPVWKLRSIYREQKALHPFLRIRITAPSFTW